MVIAGRQQEDFKDDSNIPIRGWHDGEVMLRAVEDLGAREWQTSWDDVIFDL